MKRLKKVAVLLLIFFGFAVWFEKCLLAPTTASDVREEFREATNSEKWVEFLGVNRGRAYFEIGDPDSFVSIFGLGAERRIVWVPLEPDDGKVDPDYYFTSEEKKALTEGRNPWISESGYVR